MILSGFCYSMINDDNGINLEIVSSHCDLMSAKNINSGAHLHNLLYFNDIPIIEKQEIY